jgi:hypothetical protein
LSFYNIEKTKVARSEPIYDISAFSKSIDTKNNTFILHFENMYDYEFSSIEKKYGVGFVTKIMSAV